MRITSALLERVAADEGRTTDMGAFTRVTFRAARHLPLQQRLVLALRHVLGMSALEVGTILDMSPAGVSAVEYRASVELGRQAVAGGGGQDA